MRQIGEYEYNRVGIAPDAEGNTFICYAGGVKELNLLSGVPGLQRWEEFGCLALPAHDH